MSKKKKIKRYNKAVKILNESMMAFSVFLYQSDLERALSVAAGLKKKKS